MPILKTILHFLKNHRPVNLKEVWLVLLFAMLPTEGILLQAQSPSKEYQVKAVFLFNFTRFVVWPAHAFPKENSPLVIGVLGEDPFGKYLDEAVQGEELNGHPLVVQRYRTVQEIKTCHLLFINLTKPDQLKPVFEDLKTRHILTVSDAPNFTRLGGMIRFFTESNKTRIRINLEAAKEADLTISSKLLKLAEITTTQNN